MMADPQALRLDAVGKEYVQGENRLTILDRAELTLAPGEMVALVAPSGAGKSTLLHIAGLLDRPDSGEVYIGGVACGTLGDEKRTAMRRQAIGFVYQFHHLLPEFSALENVMLPQMIGGLSQKGAATRAQELLDYMRIGARSQHRPAERRRHGRYAADRLRRRRHHDLGDARRCDLVLLLATRAVAFGPPSEVLDEAHLRAAFGHRVVRLEDGLLISEGVHHDHEH